MTRRPFMRRLVGGERGATATLFGVLLATGVVTGMLALSVDVGNAMWERRQLQNGADATAMTLARACANGEPGACDPDDPATAAALDGLLRGNAADKTAGLLEDVRADAPNGACGRGVGAAALKDCLSADPAALDGSDLRECPPLPTWLTGPDGSKVPYVETYAQTRSDGQPKLLGFFSSLFAGGAGEEDWLSACARAAWGPAGNHSATIPLTISSCEWQEQTKGGTDWVEEQPVAPKPGYGGAGQPDWPHGREIVILLHDPGDADQGCDWNGKDTAGGFGWVAEEGCKATVENGKWVNIKTGVAIPSGCKDQLDGFVGTAVSIPVFNCIVPSKSSDPPSGNWEDWTPLPNCDPTVRESSGKNTWYYIEGWARFYVSGYMLSGDKKPSLMPDDGHTTCGSGGDRCLFGWFLKGELDAEAIDTSGGTDFGTYTVLPAG